MTGWLFGGGILVACFVASNVGGSTTGPAFGPAVGADAVSKPVAAGLMSVCFVAGAWTLGRRVVTTLGEDLLFDPSLFTLEYSIVILFFIGSGLLIGNLTGAPASTSMTAVGSIVGLGIAARELRWAVIGEIVSWWVVSPVVGFWVAVTIGRYLYTRIDRLIAIDRTDGPLLSLDRTGVIPLPARGPNTTWRELLSIVVLVGIGCLMAFSSGASNIANAIAPLVGSGQLGMDRGILIGSAAVALGAFTIARRTMESLGNDITELPLTAAIIVAVVSSGIVIALSTIGVPASFVIISTVTIVGLGWGRASRTATLADAVRGRSAPQVSVGALTTDQGASTVGDPALDSSVGGGYGAVGEESTEDIPAGSALFDPETTARVVAMQNVVPIVATVGSYLTFRFLIGV